MWPHTQESEGSQNPSNIQAPTKQNIPASPGFWPCHSDNRCETCKSVLFYTSISSTNNSYKHIIKQPMTCKTKNVCYLINCKKCHKQYTGEAQLEFHKRMNNHTSDIRQKKKSTGMVRHSRRAEEHAKSRHHFTVKSMAKLPYNPRIWKTLLKAYFQQFVTVFGDCSMSKTMFKKKNQ